MEMEIYAVVKSKDSYAGNYLVTDGSKDYYLKTPEELGKYDFIEISGEFSDNHIIASSVKNLGNPKIKDVIGKLNLKLNDWNPSIKSKIIEDCRASMENVAKALKFMSIVNPKSTIRFHNDADGISSALSISQIIGGLKIQHNSAIYFNKDAFNDIPALKYDPYSAVVLLDCCTNEESIEALDLLKSADINIIAIDHHPCNPKIREMGIMLNPWLEDPEEDASKYTSGYLCFEVAKLLGHDTSKFVGISLAGDKSKIMEITPKDKERALVFDFVASYSSYGNRLDFYKDLVNDSALYSSILLKANEHIENVSDAISKSTKKEVLGNGLVFITLDIDKVAKKSEFPGRGKITSRALEMENNENAVVIGYNEKSMILRLGHAAFEKGLKANEIVKSLMAEYGPENASGGGHAKAAAFVFSGLPSEYILSQIKKIVSEVK
ncbi:MAG: hypothetical protein NTY68_03530 [Candidatus Micrarchaeota archaeon]|nr:hypothetical protein [Candidatus Micrarchaeota archaeon]